MTEPKELDQLWYTWSTNGLGSMPMGFRVRAASARFHDVQGMDYKRVDRFVRYEIPKGIRPVELDRRIAPVTLAYIYNGTEYLLVRKVFTGQDANGRNGVFFTHLIAGLPSPPDFTARDAIRLWYCPDLWVDSEQGKQANDTHLNTINYSDLKRYVQQSQTNFNMAPISHELINLLLLILREGLPPKIYVRGRSTLCTALIYGLTHCLPMSLLADLTFTTYESEVDGFEARLLGTVSADDLDSERTLVVNPAASAAPVSSDIQSYVQTVVSCLLDHNVGKLSRLLTEAEKNGYRSADKLIVLYQMRFRSGPLTFQQLEEIIRHPENNLDELGDAALQEESADLLLKEVNYWSQRGKTSFAQIVNAPASAGRVTHSQEALTTFFNYISEQVLVAMEAEILKKTLPVHPGEVLQTLTPPTMNSQIWQRMLREFAQKQAVYAEATTDALWPFREWLLRNAKLIQPLPTLDEMRPWLQVAAWDKLSRLLKLELPEDWEREAVMGMLQHVQGELPKVALPVIQAREATVKDILQLLLQQGFQQNVPAWTNIAVRFFAGLVEREYQDRQAIMNEQVHRDRLAEMNKQADLERAMLLQWLPFLLNVTPKDSTVIEQLFSNVRFQTPYQLIITEIDAVLSYCNEEVITACGDAPSLTEYLREWLLVLTPSKLVDEHARKLLVLLARQPAFEELVAGWTMISGFQYLDGITRDSLEKVKKALRHLLEARHSEQDGQQQGFQMTTQERQAVDQQRWLFVKEMVPYLVKQVKTEPDLENVLDILGKDLPIVRWDLLNLMAYQASQDYAQEPSRLTPYLFRGVYEHKHTHPPLPQDRLDNYFRNLCNGLNEDQVQKIESGILTFVLIPEAIKKAWSGWRPKVKPSRAAVEYNAGGYPGNNVPYPQNQSVTVQPTTYDGSLQPQRQFRPENNMNVPPGKVPQQNFVTPPPNSAATWSVPPQAAQSNLQQSLAGSPGMQNLEHTMSAFPQVSQAEQPVGALSPSQLAARLPASLQNQQYVATIKNPQINITRDTYLHIRNTILPMLNYWSRYYTDNHQGIWRPTSIIFEINTIQGLLEEINEPRANEKGSKLIMYLVDNVLIEHKIAQLIQQNGNLSQLFTIDKHIKPHFDFVKDSGSLMQLRDQDIEDILRIFFRRDRFVQFLENDQNPLQKRKPGKSKMEAWLEVKRAEAQVEIIGK